jgi:cell division protein FtsL
MKRAVRKFKETVEIRSSLVNRLYSHRYFPVTILVCAVLAASCFHVWQRVKVMALVKEVSYLRNENADLIDNVKKTASEISSLKMASRIEQYARDTLGLQPISADRLFTLERKKAELPPPEDLAALAAAIKRIARYMPVVSPATVNAGEIRPLKIDSAALERSDK